MSNIKIKNNIRRLRFESDEMTQQLLADRAGCTRQTIVALEAGKYNPSLSLAYLIAKALGTTIDKVFEFEADEIDPRLLDILS